MRKRTVSCLLFFLIFPGFLFSVDPTLSAQAEKVDNFILRTKDRIASSWSLCYFEFRLAFQHLGDKRVYVERDLKARTDSAMDQVTEMAVKTVGKKMDEAKDKIMDGAKEEVRRRMDQASEAAEKAAQSVSNPVSEKEKKEQK